MKELYLKLIEEQAPYKGINLFLLNASTLRHHCLLAYHNYLDDTCQVTEKGGFKFKNSMLRYLREALPTDPEVSEENKALLRNEASISYFSNEGALLDAPQVDQLGILIQNKVAGHDFAIAKKLSFKPHLDKHEGLTSFTMQSDVFMLNDAGTEIIKVIQGAGDPAMEDKYESLLGILMQHLMLHPEKAEHTTVYAAYIPAKVNTEVLAAADLVEDPEITVNRIVTYMLAQTPKCQGCRYENCPERKI